MRFLPRSVGFLAVLLLLSPRFFAQTVFHQIAEQYTWHDLTFGGVPLSALQLSEPERESILASFVTDELDSDSLPCQERRRCLTQSDLGEDYVDFGEGEKNGLAIVGRGDKALCGMAGCYTVFFRKVGSEWKLLDLSEPSTPECRGSGCAPLVARFALLDSRHHGLKDLVLGRGHSGPDFHAMTYTVWEFDGTRYVFAQCHRLEGIPEQVMPPQCSN